MRTNTIWTALVILCTIAPASAEDCKPLQYLMGLPITLARGFVLMPMTLNQRPEMMVLDTGGSANQLTHQAVKDLNLPEMQSNLQLTDVSGNQSERYVIVDDAKFGPLDVKQMEFQVSTLDDMSDANAAGLISNSILRALDMDLDFGASRVNFFSPNHCAGKVVYWPANAAAIPLRRDDNTGVVVTVEVDGHPFRAIIDTGTTLTSMSMVDAKRVFDLSPGTPGMAELKEHPNGDSSMTVYRHTFSTLSFGSVTVTNPAVLIMPDMVNSKRREKATGTLLRDPDLTLASMLIGQDILRKLHIYFSYKEGMLYVAPADDKAAKFLPAVASLPAGPAPAATPADARK